MPNARGSQQRDSIEPLLEGWRRERPDLDPWPLAILGRIQRLSHHLLRDADTWLKPLGLSWESFSLIVTLRRSGAPFALKPTDLYKESLLSSGAITNRIDRVERLGLVTRHKDPDDRRGVIVRLTAKGRLLADRAIKTHFDAMAEVLSALKSAERKQVAGLLEKLLRSIERAETLKPRRRERTDSAPQNKSRLKRRRLS